MINSAAEFVALRMSTDPDVYARAAREPAPDAVWHEVISKYPDMRSWVAHNKTVPLSVLAILATDGDSRVRYIVAGKRKATPEILRRLAGDLDEGVRLAVAVNRSTPRDILERLLADSWPRVVEVARERLASGSPESRRDEE